MAKTSKINIILSAVDKMTFIIDKAVNNGVKKFDAMKRKADSLARASAGFATNAGAMGLAAGAALAVPIKQAADFEQAMARAGAITRANDADLAKMTESARLMGRTTQFTAMQAAEAQQFLGMAGFKTNQILEALPHTLNLAAAGAIDLGRAADISSNILSGFSLQASELGKVNDVLVNTFTKSNTTLESLGETMKFVAPVAKSLGVPIEQVAAMAGKLGDAGIQGSMAGTTMRAMLLRLASPTGAAKKAMDSLGISVADASGNLRPIMQILDEVNKGMQGMGSAKQADVLQTIFGTEASAGVTQLLAQAGAGELQKFVGELTKSGAASSVASKQMATAQGAMKLFESATQDLFITLGNTLLPAFTKFVQKANEIVGVIAKFANENPQLAKTIGMVAAAFAGIMAILSGAGFLLSGVASFFGTIGTLGPIVLKALGFVATGIRAIGAAMIANPILAIIAAIALAAYLIYDNWGPISAWFMQKWEQIKAIFQQFLSWWDSVDLYQVGVNILEGLWNGLKAAHQKVLGFVVELGQDISKSFKSVLGIESPSKVFIQHGQDIAKGAEIGMAMGNAGASMGAMAGQTIANQAGAAVPALAGGGSAGISINYSPSVTIAGASEAAKQDFEALLRKHGQEIAQIIQDVMAREQRLSF